MEEKTEKTKIIIDTDIGDDADDALAICLAVKSRQLDILGITTVFLSLIHIWDEFDVCYNENTFTAMVKIMDRTMPEAK